MNLIGHTDRSLCLIFLVCCYTLAHFENEKCILFSAVVEIYKVWIQFNNFSSFDIFLFSNILKFIVIIPWFGNVCLIVS